MPGVGGGVCKSTWSPTPQPCGPFQWATLRPWLSQLTGLLLTEQPFGKIYSLRQFRHLPAQLLHGFDQLGVVFGGSGVRRSVPQPLGVGPPDRRQRDHPGEKTTNRHDRDKQRQNVFHLPIPGFGEEPFREVHSFGQLRDFLANRVKLIQNLVPLGGIDPRLAMLTGDALGDRRRNGTEHPECPPKKHEGRDGCGPVHVCDFFASSRSAKSTRSPRSPISWRACWISARRSSRSSCSSSLTPASTLLERMRSARARTSGNSSTVDPMMVNVKRKATPSGGIGYLAGGSRSASRCFATNRSRKSTRSPSSLSCSGRCRISSTSPRSAFSSSAASSSTGFLPEMRAANALPSGEMARRNTVPPPNSMTTATSPTMSSGFTWELPARRTRILLA